MTKGQKLALGITVGIPLVCLLGGFGVMKGLFGSAAADRDRELARARADGLPTTTAEISAMTRVPDAENAAPFYGRIEALAGDRGPLCKDRGQVNSGWSVDGPADAAAVTSLARLRPALDLARHAVQFPHCDFRRDWAKANLLFPEYGTLRGLAKALCLEARLRSDKGDWRGALADLDVAEQMSHHIREEPILSALVVSISMESMVQVVFRKMVDKHWHDREFLTVARRTLARFGALGDLRRATIGDFALGRIMLSQVRSFRDLGRLQNGSVEANANPNAFEQGFFQSGIVKDAFEARLIRAYRQLIENLPADPSQWEKTYDAALKADRAAMSDHSIASMGYQAEMPVFAWAGESIVTQVERRNLDDTVLRLLEVTANTGKLPRHLPDFGPTTIDPFSGSPFVYRRVGKGFMVYSFGRERVDHGGKESPHGMPGMGYDDVFHVHG